ncbi:response regulator [Paenarthrobacter nicotinovorans]|uniref:Response regulator n=1 Tax=Paenarthrobacter nicotinovorans TaxID=29320 RepID=A0ABV0GMK2_PAENI
MTEHRAVVIEDDPDIALLITTIIESMGYTVRTAQTGPAGIHAVRAVQPAVITTDLGLPEMNGLEVIKAIRERSHAPILVISANHDPDTVEHALAAGANGFLPKPFRPGALRDHLKELQNDPAATNFPGQYS